MKICEFLGWEFMSLSHKYKETVRKFFFLTQLHFKAELYIYIYVVVFAKHPSELYWNILMPFYNHFHNILRLLMF